MKDKLKKIENNQKYQKSVEKYQKIIDKYQKSVENRSNY
jgi:hypothetical protein